VSTDPLGDVTALRQRLRASGFDPIPVNGKAPKFRGWEGKHNVTAEEIQLWEKLYPHDLNTGILAKFAPAIDIDLIDTEAAEAIEDLAREHFEERGCVLVRIGKAPKRLVPLRTTEPFSKVFRALIAPNGTEQRVEVLASGQQFVASGIHPDTGRPYQWHGGELGKIKREDLPYVRKGDIEKFLDDAAKLLVEKFGFREKAASQTPDQDARRQHKADSKWGELNERALANLGRWVPRLFPAARKTKLGYRVASADLGRGREEDLSLTSNGIKYFGDADMGDPRQGRRTPIDTVMEWGHLEFAAAARWLEDALANTPDDEKPTKTSDHAQTASDAMPLFDPWAQYAVPEFPFHVLPPVAQDFVDAQATVIGCDPSAMAMAMLTAVSGALDHRCAVKMLRNGNWWEHPRLWVLLVSDPSCKKTPIINTATRPLEHHQNTLRLDYEARLRDYEAAKEKEDDEEKKAEKPELPARFVVWDTTVEKLGEILSRSEHGLLVKRDEFSGWIGQMEKYAATSRGAGADRGFWLQAYDGGPYTIDRIGRGETYIRNLSVSLLGGIQPARLAELHGLTSDGLLQRFIPVMMAPSKLARDEPCDDEGYSRLIYGLISTRARCFVFNDAALVEMNELRSHLHQLEQASGGMATGFQAFIGKLAGLSGALAIILHVAEDPKKNVDRDIELLTAMNVRSIVRDFVIPHALEFYRTAEGLTNGDRLKKLASWLLTSGRDRLVASDLTTNVADLRGLTLFDLNQRVSPLVAAGWLAPAEPALGPANRAWNVNPVLATQFAERTRLEAQRKAKLAKLMGSPRKIEDEQ
jgi:hypothetical protein